MSVLINASNRRGAKDLTVRFLLGTSLLAVGLSFWVMYQASQRTPLPEVQSLAFYALIASGAVSVLLFLLMRRLSKQGFQTRLMAEFFQEIEDPIFFVNKFGRPVLMNVAGQKFLTRSEDSVIEQLAERLMHEDTEGAKGLASLAEAVANLESAEADVMIIDQIESAQRLLVSCRPLKGQGLNILRVIDMSQRSGSVASNHHGLSQLIQILDHVPIGLFSVDENDKVTAVNWTLSEWLNSTPTDLIEATQPIDTYIVSKKSEETPTSVVEEDVDRTAEEVAFKGRGGEIFHAFLGRVAITQENGQVLRGGLVLREDASDGDWQVALRRSKLLFKRFFEEAPVGIVLLDLDGRVTESNRMIRDTMGRDIVGDLMSQCIEEEDRAELAKKMAEAISLGDTLEAVEVRLKCEPETISSVYVGRMEDDQETAFGLMLHFIDMTEQKSLEQQFVQSQKMQAVGQLAGGVAHDFNNLLTAMIGYCDLLLMRHKPGDPSFADINQIKQNGNRAAGLVRQLLAFSRQQKLDPKVLNLVDSISELSNLINRLIGENIELDIQHERDLWLVKADQGQFEQVVINLAVNARDAMEGEGDLKIRTMNATIDRPIQRGAEVMPPGEYVQVEVTDTGHGIPQDIIERIFEPFFSTKEVGSGTGLGLSTVYGIIKQTNGYVFVDSVINSGTTFHVYFPRHILAEGEEAATGTISTLSAETRASLPLGDAPPEVEEDLTGTEVILFAEDEDPVRTFTTRALENKGYKVMAGNSGEAALDLLKEYGRPVDLLLTDVMMPGMDGPSLIEKVREIQPGVKVLCISGYSEDSLRQRITTDKDVHFLAKPFNLKEIAAKVKSIISPEDQAPPTPAEEAPKAEELTPSPTPEAEAPPTAVEEAVEKQPSKESAKEPDVPEVPVTPKEKEAPEAEKPAAAVSTGSDSSGPEILYAEDEDPVRAFTTRALGTKGFKIIEAESGERALEIMEERGGKPIDLLITDVMMPGIDGPTLINKMREQFPDLKVICVSGYSEDALRDKITSDKEVHFLAKPFSLKDITAKVQELLEE